MKPILFNTEMVRAILNGTKTVTRRVVKEPYYIDKSVLLPESGFCMHRGTRVTDGMPYPDSIYDTGDILYVRETWRVQSARRFDADARIEFKTGGDMVRIQFPGGGDQYHSRREYDAFVARWADDRWHPSIHMPREAARIFLKVTSVQVERLQDITEEQALKEGVYSNIKDYGIAIFAFLDLWGSTIKPADRVLYGLEENPWVWVIEFERCEKPEGD